MTRKSEAIDAVDRYLRAGGSVCPYARRATIHYAMDNEALGPTRSLVAFTAPGEGTLLGPLAMSI